MRYILASIVLLLSTLLSAQISGTISYTEEVKLNIPLDGIKGIKNNQGIDISSMMPKSKTEAKLLHIDDNISIYKNDVPSEDDDKQIDHEDSNIRIVFNTNQDESILYTDHQMKKSIEQTSFMGKTFLINYDIHPLKWKITNEKIKYLDYECIKATAQGKMDDEGKQKEIVAWFTPQLPVSIGPARYHGLPGAILLLSIDGDKTEIRATSVSLEKPTSEQLEKPSKGKKVTAEEFKKQMEEYKKDLEDTHGARGRNIFIRSRG